MPQAAAPQHTPHKPSLVSTYLWLATVPLTWGFNFVALKILYKRYEFSVTGLLSARYILMVPLLLGLLMLSERSWRIRREHWKHLAIFSFFTVGIYQYLFAKAIDPRPAGRGQVGEQRQHASPGLPWDDGGGRAPGELRELAGGAPLRRHCRRADRLDPRPGHRGQPRKRCPFLPSTGWPAWGERRERDENGGNRTAGT